MNTPRPTPETDENRKLIERFTGCHQHVSADFARRLERERDEAREELEANGFVLQKLQRERDSAIERFDAMDRLHIARMAEMGEELESMREAIKEAYEALKELRSFYLDMTGLPPCAANAALAKLQPFTTP